MTNSSARTFGSDFRQFFLRGLVVLLPSVLTLWIVVKAYQFVDNTIAQPINSGVQLALVNVADHWDGLAEAELFKPTPKELQAARLDAGLSENDTSEDARLIPILRRARIEAWWSNQWYMNLIGLVVAIVAVYLSGRLLGGFFGRRIYRKLEALITTVPVFKQVYPYVKQIVDFLFSDDQPIKFNRVVAVEYPRKGIWSIGFMTGGPLRTVADRAGDVVTVFIPSSPTPFTGYTITVPRAEMIEIPISVDEAIRFAVSGGVLVPDHQETPRLKGTGGSVEDMGLIPIPGGPAEAPGTVERDQAPATGETRTPAPKKKTRTTGGR
ncbi:MAG: DUF502 domain-containing protein [Planctomycetota bacterium]|jgi:uncharacterized membrane protein